MGCDIHVYVEKRNNQGKWELVKGVNPRIEDYRDYAASAKEKGDIERYNEMTKKATEIESGEMLKKEVAWRKENGYEISNSDLDYYSPVVAKDWLYENRNYNLFGILAGVREYSINPISEPKGMPSDLCEYIKSECESWDCDGHTHSYYTFRELIDFDWMSSVVHNEAWVSEKVYKQFKETGDPYPCSGGVYGKNIEKITNKEMDRVLRDKYPWESEKSFYTIVSWERPYYEYGQYLLENIYRYLEDNPTIDAKNIRMVFWFDN